MLIDKIKKLTHELGVSGDEMRVAAIAAEMIKEYTEDVTIDEFGNVVGVIPCGKENAPKLMLDAHIDQIGFIVTEITDGGFLRFMAIGVDQRMLPGSEVVVLTKTGNIRGIIGSVPPHLQKGTDKTNSIAIADMAVDIGMTGEQAKQIVSVGDYMTFYGDGFILGEEHFCSKALDDRACLVCILHALDLLKGEKLDVDLIISASIKEELGCQGAPFTAHRYQPDFAIAVDVSHAKTADAPDVINDLGKGPIIEIGYNSRPEIADLVIDAAKKNDIPYQLSPVPAGSGTNAWTLQPAGKGIGTLVLSLPLKYMHSPVEVLRISDVENTGKLLAAFIKSFDGRCAL